jgi:GxxExxY protein
MKRDERTHAIIGASMEVHNILGPGRLEAVYHEALEIEFGLREIHYVSKPQVEIVYKGHKLKQYYVPDFLVLEDVVVEIKAEVALTKIDEAQIINSLKCCSKKVGLLINFGGPSLQWKRFVN